MKVTRLAFFSFVRGSVHVLKADVTLVFRRVEAVKERPSAPLFKQTYTVAEDKVYAPLKEVRRVFVCIYSKTYVSIRIDGRIRNIPLSKLRLPYFRT